MIFANSIRGSCLAILVGVATSFAAAGPPADRNAAPQTVRWLDQIVDRAASDDDRVWIGQNFGHSNRNVTAGYYQNVQRLIDETQRTPFVLAVDYGYNRIGRGYGNANRHLMEHASQGGVVTISLHPRNPWRWSDCHDTRLGDWKLLFEPGSAAYQRWQGVLSRVADGLEALQTAGVVVLFRPFHEMNGGWFWWSGSVHDRRISREEFFRLWRQMFDYLTNERQLHNLLWVYSPSAVYGPQQRAVDVYYPGDAWVDIVALDYYGDPEAPVLAAGLEGLSRLKKPVAISEFGFSNRAHQPHDNRRLLAALERYPVRPVYVVYWHSWPRAPVAIVDNLGARQLMHSPDVIHLTLPAKP